MTTLQQGAGVMLLAAIFSTGFFMEWVECVVPFAGDFSLIYLLKKVLMGGVTIWIVQSFWREAGRRRRSRLKWVVLGLLCLYGVYFASAFSIIGLRFLLWQDAGESMLSMVEEWYSSWLLCAFLTAFILAVLAVLALRRSLLKIPHMK